MKFKELFSGLVPSASPQSPLRDLVEQGRRAKYAEDYPAARAAFDQALADANGRTDGGTLTVIATHRADVMAHQGQIAEAERMLSDLQTRVPTEGQRSYLYSAAGALAQARGDWSAARDQYERALKAARLGVVPGAEGRALGYLASTYLQDGNASYAAHLLREALPKLNTAGDIELSSYFVGMLGEALILSGQDAEGSHLLTRALQLAEQISYRQYERRWGMALGARALDEARYADARACYVRVLRLFEPETRTQEHVSALCQMSKACLGLRLYAEALDYAQTALRAAEPLGGDTLRLAQGAVGVALRAVGRGREAIPLLQAAGDTPSPLQVEVLRALAAAQTDGGDTDAALATYGRALTAAKALNTPLEVAQVRRDLGLVYLKRGQTPQAIQEWTAALAIYDERKAYAQVARLYSDIAGARKSLGQGARALKDYEQALMTLNSVDENDFETRGLVLSNAANAYAESGDAESADAFFNEAISLAERLGDAASESTRSGNYGWFLLMVGRPRRAISLLGRALEISQKLNLTLQQAVQTDNLGLAYESLGDMVTALDYHRKALDLVAPLDHPYWEASFAINEANALLSLGQLDEARARLEAALAQGRAAENADLIIRAQTVTARLALVLRDPETADAPLAEAVLLARRTDSRRLLAEALSVRSQQQAMMGQTESANAAWDEALKLYTMLRMPQGKAQPAWLVSSSS
jgi:tetratricopeptide (TPR) repeat protein